MEIRIIADTESAIKVKRKIIELMEQTGYTFTGQGEKPTRRKSGHYLYYLNFIKSEEHETINDEL